MTIGAASRAGPHRHNLPRPLILPPPFSLLPGYGISTSEAIPVGTLRYAILLPVHNSGFPAGSRPDSGRDRIKFGRISKYVGTTVACVLRCLFTASGLSIIRAICEHLVSVSVCVS